MFRLNDAVRRYQAQHQSPPDLRCVATSVPTLSPHRKPVITKGCAAVADVASTPHDPEYVSRLIGYLRDEGALLQYCQNSLLIRPSNWNQLRALDTHWKALLLFLKETELGDDDGSSRST